MLSEVNTNYQIEHYVNGLLFLLQHPNVDSRLNSKVTATASKLKFFVREAMMGKTVHGMKFPCVLTRPLTFEENLEVFMEGFDCRTLFLSTFGTSTKEFHITKLIEFMTSHPTAKTKIETMLPFLRPALDASLDLSLCYLKTTSGAGLCLFCLALSVATEHQK